MINLAIIPARSGSKSFKNKNIKKINKKTLIEIAYQTAKNSKIFTDIIVSTDSIKYANILKKKKIFINSLRSKKFAKDNTTDLQLLNYEIKKYEIQHKKKINYISLLQPTSPLRTKKDLIKCFKLISNKKLDAVWTISKIDKKFNPIKVLVIKNHKLKYFSKLGPTFVSRQQLHESYIRNGIAYFFSRKAIMNYKKILPFNSSYIKINRKIVNIDSKKDFDIAKKIYIKKVLNLY
jgi:CMP-N,N'-diacetyllegionaminic acid synthase